MKRIFSFTFILTSLLFSQQELQIVSLDVRASVNERTGETVGNVFLRINNRTVPSGAISFFVPIAWDIGSLRDENNDSYDSERSSSERKNFYRLTLERTEETQSRDTLTINIEFTARFDSSSMADMFVNPAEILLPCSDTISWIPLFGSAKADRLSLEISTNPSFVMFSDHHFDTTMTEAAGTWKITGTESTSISSAFTLCGISNPVKHVSFNADSSHSISFFSSPVIFDQRYAAAVTRQLSDAGHFFAAATGRVQTPSITYAIVGGPTFEPEIFRSEHLVIHRNSPAFGTFDSSALNRIQYNHWLFETAQQYCPKTDDSTALFDDGFAAFLCLRYLAARYPHLEQEERVMTIAHALTFFPSGTISAGHHSPSNTNEIVSYRGRYFFSMLEYLLGKESFDSVIVRMSGRFSTEQITFRGFQTICEEEYGSPLGWFFDQWLHRSTAPEFVMQWKHEKTPRGMIVVTVTAEQRGELFTMPVPIVFSFGPRMITKRVLMEQAKQDFLFTFPSPPTAVVLDPNHSILRWLLEIRISAHARTSLQFLSVSRDIANAEREAQYTLQLDPNNSTGSAPLVYFVLGNSAAARNDLEKGKEYFLKAMSAGAAPETEKYKLLSVVQYANIIEAEGKREEAVTYYRRAVSEGMVNPLLYERAIIKAEMHLHTSFNNRSDAWFELH